MTLIIYTLEKWGRALQYARTLLMMNLASHVLYAVPSVCVKREAYVLLQGLKSREGRDVWDEGRGADLGGLVHLIHSDTSIR